MTRINGQSKNIRNLNTISTRYTSNYILIYLTQGLSMFLGFISLFIVTPFLTSNKEIYGIYSVCLSLTIFFSYADIGFVTSGQKFASEAFVNKKKEEEYQIMGFSSFVLLCFLFVISFGIFFLACYPNLLISDISNENYTIARSLLLILSCSFPVFCFQRIIHVLYSIRMSDYYFQLIQIIGNILKISSVFFFFSKEYYNIVGYYLCIQIVNLGVVLCASIFLHIKFRYSLITLIKNIKYNRTVFMRLKGLAFASLFGTISWILFFELDNIVISSFWGAKAVAIYAVAFSVLTMFRTVFGSLYTPYVTRFNYFVGLNDRDGLNSFLKMVIEFFIPITIIPILIMVFSAKPFVFSWVGIDYVQSVPIMICLLLGIIFTFISTPSGLYITALAKNKYLYVSNIIIVIIYWGGIILCYKNLGLLSFAIFKCLSFILSAIYISRVAFYLMQEAIFLFIKKLIKIYLIPLALCSFICYLLLPLMSFHNSHQSIIYNLIIIVFEALIGFVLVYIFSPLHRFKIYEVMLAIKLNMKNLNKFTCHTNHTRK